MKIEGEKTMLIMGSWCFVKGVKALIASKLFLVNKWIGIKTH